MTSNKAGFVIVHAVPRNHWPLVRTHWLYTTHSFELFSPSRVSSPAPIRVAVESKAQSEVERKRKGEGRALLREQAWTVLQLAISAWRSRSLSFFFLSRRSRLERNLKAHSKVISYSFWCFFFFALFVTTKTGITIKNEGVPLDGCDELGPTYLTSAKHVRRQGARLHSVAIPDRRRRQHRPERILHWVGSSSEQRQ